MAYASNYHYDLNHAHQLFSIDFTNSRIGYDANGNRTTGSGHTLTWNYDNQIATTFNANNIGETMGYDAQGERVSRAVSGGVTTFFLGGGLWEEDTDGTTRTIYQFNGQVLAQRTDRAGALVNLLYLYNDHLGSASLAIDQNGNVVSQQQFDPWGNLRSGSGTISQTDVNYTGQVKDGSGLLYYHARYYDTFLGRFTSPDTVVEKRGDPQSRNRYSYVRNNPLTGSVNFQTTG